MIRSPLHLPPREEAALNKEESGEQGRASRGRRGKNIRNVNNAAARSRRCIIGRGGGIQKKREPVAEIRVAS